MKNLLILTFLVYAIIACENKRQDGQSNSTLEEHAVETNGVQLNDGEKWEANLETTEGIRMMISRIESFNKENSEEYTVLQTNLQSDFKMIFQKCTMKGEAHDQLHNYLLPLKKELDQLSAANLDSVSAYLQTYSQYFQ